MAGFTRRALAGGALALAASPAHADPSGAPAPLYGKADAPKRLIVWGSCTCSFTAALYGVLVGLQREAPERVAFEWRHFPTHAPDPALHVAALSFAGARFWDFAFDILAHVTAAGGQFSGLTPEAVLKTAQAHGGGQSQLDRAYADPAKWAAVKQDLIAGKLLGVTRTPGLFHDGYFLTPEGLPLDVEGFRKSLRAMIAA